MAAVTSPETSPQPRVYFQTPAGTTEEPETPVRKQGRVTVKYDRKELRKRLNLEEWIIDQLTDLYDCEEEAIPELEIDVDELLDMPSDVERAARVKDLLVDCFKPTELYFLPTHSYTIFHLSEEEEETSPLITASRVTEIEKKNERAQMPKRQRKGERGGGLEEGRSQSTRFCLTNLYVAVFEGFKVDPAAHYNSFHTSRFNLRASL
uniref:Protein phosphatase 1, regulatory (inhibitor) subunit 14Ba n=1 Tax=Astatotilapia calliptera TaxID=8154 RepID=A0AAX7SZZ2_ASTCA